MSDNQIDNSYDIDTIINEMKKMKSHLEDIERTLQEIRDNSAYLRDIKDYLYEMKSK